MSGPNKTSPSPRSIPPLLCRGCGCTNEHGCLGGCHWVLCDLNQERTGVCSQCAIDLGWSPRALALVGCDEPFPLAAAEGVLIP